VTKRVTRAVTVGDGRSWLEALQVTTRLPANAAVLMDRDEAWPIGVRRLGLELGQLSGLHRTQAVSSANVLAPVLRSRDTVSGPSPSRPSNQAATKRTLADRSAVTRAA
jgi:hypothetical protein